MVSQGWALAYRQYPRDYVPQENGAKDAKLRDASVGINAVVGAEKRGLSGRL